jgi:methyl-accepting chemotaxis protein
MSITRQHPGQSPTAPRTANHTTLYIRPKARRSGNLLLELSIGQRLTVGFLLAALIATLVASLVGIQRSQSLSRQSDFYQHLLKINTSLNTGANFLQLINTLSHTHIETASAPQPSQETLKLERKALQDLTRRYNDILNSYQAQDLLKNHPEQIALLSEAGDTGRTEQQLTLLASALRTWQVQRIAQEQLLQYIQSGNLEDAKHILRFQAEPTNADSLSALRALIQFNQRLATSVRTAAGVEELNQLITTIIGSILAFIAIIIVGWLISGTLVRRLRQLRHVMHTVEQGQLDARIDVIGRDEIADVSASVNAMLEAIVSLLQETRHQRDALTNAAEHLFSDMRVVSAGDLRINAPVSDDPIGLLANAFNFTVSRFRRFVMRVQTSTEQLDVLSRQQLERTESFLLTLTTPQSPFGGLQAGAKAFMQKERVDSGDLLNLKSEQTELIALVQRTRERLHKLSIDGIHQRARSMQGITEQISLKLNHLGKVATTENMGNTAGNVIRMHLQEIHMLENLLQRALAELDGVQQNTTRHFIELDRDLTSLTNALRKNAPTTNALSAGNKEVTPDLLRQSTHFISEMNTLAQKYTALTQEIRNGIISFQLDVPEGARSISAAGVNTPGGSNRPAANYKLSTGAPTPERNAQPSFPPSPQSSRLT